MPGSGLWESYYCRMHGVWPEPPRQSGSDVKRGELIDEVFNKAQAMLEPSFQQWERDNSTGRPDLASPAPQPGGQPGPGLTASGVPEFAEAEPR